MAFFYSWLFKVVVNIIVEIPDFLDQNCDLFNVQLRSRGSGNGILEKKTFCNKCGSILIIIENSINNLTSFGYFSLEG